MNKQQELGGFFDKYLDQEPLFTDKSQLQSIHIPKHLFHRDSEMDQLGKILAPALRDERPSNIFLYGKTGTGKTAAARNIKEHLLAGAEKHNISLTVLYVNCKLKKVADTEYRIIAHLTEELGLKLPKTGLATEEIYKGFVDRVEALKGPLIIILDEIDYLVKKVGDDILYTLTRMNEDQLSKGRLTLIGISNDLLLADRLDPRVKSSLSEEEIIFPPYNALQLKDILSERAAGAFKKGVLEQGVVEKCAAYAAREHGDSRRALELMRVAGELAERHNQDKVTIQNVDQAEEKIERDRVFDMIVSQPQQVQLTLYCILKANPLKKGMIFTGEVYEIYKNYCTRIGFRPLTQRRMSDILAELDMFGIINARIISKGRYGRTREITLTIPSTVLPKIERALEESLGISK